MIMSVTNFGKAIAFNTECSPFVILSRHWSTFPLLTRTSVAEFGGLGRLREDCENRSRRCPFEGRRTYQQEPYVSWKCHQQTL